MAECICDGLTTSTESVCNCHVFSIWTGLDVFSVEAVISAFSECRCNRLSQQRSQRQAGEEVTLLLCWSEVLFFASLVKSKPCLQVQNWPLSIKGLVNVLSCLLLSPKISCKIMGFCLQKECNF